MAGMIVLSIPVMAAFEKHGFKKAVGFGVVLTGICAIVRGVFGDSYTAVLIATVGFAVAQPFLLNSPGLVAGNFTMMLIASLLYGIFIVGAAPLTLTFAAEASFPTSEGTSEGLLMWAGNVAGVIFLGAASLFGSNKAVMIALVAVTALYLIPMFMAKETKLQKK